MTISRDVNYHSMYDHDGIRKYFPNRILEGDSYQGKLESVNRGLDDCVVWVTFWGAREIVTKRDGEFPILPVSLDAIARKIIYTTPINPSNSGRTLSPNELRVRKEIVEKIQNFYSTSDVQISNSNCITRFFNLIRELFGNTRWHIENGL
jgi:hypothetical protein